MTTTIDYQIAENLVRNLKIILKHLFKCRGRNRHILRYNSSSSLFGSLKILYLDMTSIKNPSSFYN